MIKPKILQSCKKTPKKQSELLTFIIYTCNDNNKNDIIIELTAFVWNKFLKWIIVSNFFFDSFFQKFKINLFSIEHINISKYLNFAPELFCFIIL